jgi:hypothetical protein
MDLEDLEDLEEEGDNGGIETEKEKEERLRKEKQQIEETGLGEEGGRESSGCAVIDNVIFEAFTLHQDEFVRHNLFIITVVEWFIETQP